MLISKFKQGGFIKHRVSTNFLIIGIFLTALAYFNAINIPWKANEDYLKFCGLPESKSCYAERLSSEPIRFYKAQVGGAFFKTHISAVQG